MKIIRGESYHGGSDPTNKKRFLYESILRNFMLENDNNMTIECLFAISAKFIFGSAMVPKTPGFNTDSDNVYLQNIREGIDVGIVESVTMLIASEFIQILFNRRTYWITMPIIMEPLLTDRELLSKNDVVENIRSQETFWRQARIK